MRVSLLGKDYEVAVKTHESFGESVYHLTLKEPQEKEEATVRKEEEKEEAGVQGVRSDSLGIRSRYSHA